MVELIRFWIPTDADVENPIEDAAFMAHIGAEQIYISTSEIGTRSGCELKNAATGTRFTFFLCQSLEVRRNSFWYLQKL